MKQKNQFRVGFSEIPGKGAEQLPDLFECLPAEEASREFFHELEKIRSLCMNILATMRSESIVNSKARQDKNSGMNDRTSLYRNRSASKQKRAA